MILYCAYNKRIADELTAKLAEPATDRNWSDEQMAIFYAFQNQNSGNVVVVARAGVGKTTTGIAGVRMAPEGKNGIHAKTLHALGFSFVRKFWEGVTVKFDSSRADALAEQVCGPKAPDVIKRLVSKLHTKGREIVPHATCGADLLNLAITFELEPDETWDATGYGTDYVCAKAAEAMEAAAAKPANRVIDGSDMIFLPLRNGWLSKTYDMVVVDEAQDMTAAQLEIAQGVCRGRIFVIGDDRQAIYAFRGADSGSLGRLKTELNARELKLTTTYRCGKAIVEAAQAYVPDFQAGPGNPNGAVTVLPDSKLVATAGPGDFILSRVNAPLVSIAMQLLRAGKRTRVAGRDIGAGLKTLVRKLRGSSVPDFLKKVSAWETRELNRVMASFKGKGDIADNATFMGRLDTIRDQAEMLTAFADGAKNVDEVTARIEALFTDDGLGEAGMITCSSVHRSKGLEANRVFVLHSTLRSHNQEELNITYVAITRAKAELVWVGKEAA